MFTVLTSVYINDNPNEFDLSLESLHLQVLQPSQIILVVDGPISEDLSLVIKKYKNLFLSRLEVYELAKNVGLANAMNFGLERVKYDLIARHDGDDISMPDRFETQVKHMIENPQIDILGSQVIEGINIQNAEVIRSLPCSHAEIVASMWIRNPINHPSVIYKKSVINLVDGYTAQFGDDDYLWAKLYVAGARFENLSIPLVFLRRNDTVFNRRGAKWFLGDLEVRKLLFYNKKIGLFKFITSVLAYAAYRFSPPLLKKNVYRLRRFLGL